MTTAETVIEELGLESSAVRIHLVLECEGCDWSTSDYLKGDVEAKDHAVASGHTVKGEYGLAVEIQP